MLIILLLICEDGLLRVADPSYVEACQQHNISHYYNCDMGTEILNNRTWLACPTYIGTRILVVVVVYIAIVSIIVLFVVVQCILHTECAECIVQLQKVQHHVYNYNTKSTIQNRVTAKRMQHDFFL